MNNKLNAFSKILIATSQINYMANSINSANEVIKMLPDSRGALKEGIKERDDALEETVKKLGEVMEDLGNLINNHDCICKLDERVAKVPFEIIIEGKDDTEKDYDEELDSDK